MQSNKWWPTVKSAVFGTDMTVPVLLIHDGSPTHDPLKSAVFGIDMTMSVLLRPDASLNYDPGEKTTLPADVLKG